MSATRSSDLPVGHREGPDLDALVAEIAAEHPQPVRFLDIDRVRRGGVLGFFAKEQYALTYELAGAESQPTADARPARHRAAPAPAEHVDLDELLGRADALDARPALSLVPSPPPVLPPVQESTPGDRFADILYGLARDVVDEPVVTSPSLLSDPAGGRHRQPTPVFEPTPLGGERPAPVVATVPVSAVLTPPPVEPAVVVEPAVPVELPVAVPLPVITSVDDRLAALGMPARRGDSPSADPARAALAGALIGALDALPVPPAIPAGAGDLVVVVGDVRSLLGIDVRRVSGRHEARAAVAAVRAGSGSGLLAIDAEDPALSDLVAGADLVVVAIEATGKSSDHRQLLARITAAGAEVGALAVDRAADTASPASVWELGLPVLTLDGQRADTARWLGVLLDAARTD